MTMHSMLACSHCVAGGRLGRLVVGLTNEGLEIRCEQHGLVVHYTPALLTEHVARGPMCSHCGEPHSAHGGQTGYGRKVGQA